MDDPAPDERRRTRGVTVGLILITVGLAMLIDRLGISDLRLTAHLWPFVVLVLGAVQLSAPAGPDGRRGRTGAAWLLIVGVWGLVSEFRLFDLDYGRSWPLIVIGAGVMLVIGARSKRESGGSQTTEDR